MILLCSQKHREQSEESRACGFLLILRAFAICVQYLNYLKPRLRISVIVSSGLPACPAGKLLCSGLSAVCFRVIVRGLGHGFDCKGSSSQGNTDIPIGWEQFVFLFGSLCYLKSIIGANLLENVQSPGNGRRHCSQLPCVRVLYSLYLLSDPDMIPNLVPVKTNFSSFDLPTCTSPALAPV